MFTNVVVTWPFVSRGEYMSSERGKRGRQQKIDREKDREGEGKSKKQRLNSKLMLLNVPHFLPHYM